ncbi:xylulokinase [Kutzneria chonburiensis]|nr:FGGY-family carbohydrate kinase [Kutzneria chonburiensis]
MREVMLGIDVGTTAAKVAAFGLDGEPLETRTVGYPIHRPRLGWAEQDANDWWRAVDEGVTAMTARYRIRAAGIVSQVNTHLLVDADLNPLTTAIIWQDQRCAAIAKELDGRYTEADKQRIWGGPIVLDASFVGARAEWFARNEPEAWRKARWILSPKDFIGAKLTGRVATDLLSGVRIANADGYLAEAMTDGLQERLPEILAPETILGNGLVVGTMDAYGAVFGTATTEPGRGMISCGTSLVVAGASTENVPTAGIVTFPPRNGLYVHAGPTQAAGDAVRWWSETSGLSIPEVFADAANGRSQVIFTPYLSGERAPLWDSSLRASFLNVSAATTRADLSRAVLEGVAMSARHVLDFVEQAAGRPMKALAFVGGGARSDFWAQLHADVLQRPVRQLRVHDSAALGAALLGSVGAGLHPDVETAGEAAVAVRATVEPSESNHLYEVYVGIHQALHDIHHRLNP